MSFFEDLGLREPDFYLDTVGNDLGETIGNIIAKSIIDYFSNEENIKIIYIWYCKLYF